MGMPRIIVTTHDGAVVGDLDPTLVTALTMTRQVNGEHSLSVTTTQALAKNDRLLLRDGTLKWHEFVVEGITAARPDSGSEVEVAYYCPWSVQHDLSETFVNGPYDCGIVPGHASIMHPAIDGITVALGSTSRWAIGTVDVATQAAASFYRQTGWEGMQTVVEKWGGEVEADITVGLDGVTGRSVSLLAHVGNEEATRRFDYSADMKSIKRTVQDTPWTCRIVPLGKSRETEAGGYTRRPSIESVNDGVMWIEDADAVPLTRVPDGSGGWEYPTQIVYNDVYEEPAELLAWAREHITDYTRPKVTYEADVVQLARAGLSPLGVGLGDEVAIVDRAFCEGGLRIQGRVLKMVEDLLDPSNTKLTIGNLGTTLASQLSGIAREVYEITSKVDNMTQVQGTAEYVSDLIARMNAEANATGGYTYITEGQGIRTYDRAVSDPLVGAEATQVVEVKGGNVRIANSRTSTGDWDWRTVIVSGHVASDLVTTAQLVAGTIRPATGSDWWDLDNNILHIGAVDTLETLVHPYGDGVIVCKTDQTIGALVNADGSFDVVSVTWNGGVPQAGDPFMKATSNGTVVYDGLGTEDSNVVAEFVADGAQIGVSDNSHIEMDYHSLKLIDKEQNVYFHVSDLRDKSGLATITDVFTGDGTTTRFSLSLLPSSLTSVTVSDGSGGSYTQDGTTLLDFSTAPSAGATITVEYTTTDDAAKAYTLGTRNDGIVGAMSVVAGESCVASGSRSYAEGYSTTASGAQAHAEGGSTTASGGRSHAEGYRTTASGAQAHAEGQSTTASGINSHAEGYSTTASGNHSHAEGVQTTASGDYSHAEGWKATASNTYAHAEGMQTTASGIGSHAQNGNTIAASAHQTAMGRYNVADSNDTYALIIGNGTSNKRSNAMTVSWAGSIVSASAHVIRDTRFNRDGANPSSNVWSAVHSIQDADGENLCYMQAYQTTDGGVGMNLWVTAEDTDGTERNNHIRIWVGKSGNKAYSVGDAAAFLRALGVTSGSSTTSTGVWHWVKLPGNIAIAHYDDTSARSIAVTSASGSIYWGSVSNIAFPFTFSAIPTVSVSLSGTGNAWTQASGVTTSGTGTMFFGRGTSTTLSSRLHITVVGCYS